MALVLEPAHQRVAVVVRDGQGGAAHRQDRELALPLQDLGAGRGIAAPERWRLLEQQLLAEQPAAQGRQEGHEPAALGEPGA